MTAVLIPYNRLSPEALNGLIGEFVTRNGTDYGEEEAPLETKFHQVLQQLQSGKAIILYDEETESCNILSAEDIRLKSVNPP
jgi:uncharacterized protein YheU (UPF0270 family)